VGSNNYFPESTDIVLENLLSQYKETELPINISFRNLVNWLPNSDRATHLIHPYPAKLLMHIPHFFLSNTIFSKPRDVILDPFCGSGTVLLEAILSGRNAFGADSNPIAQLISKVKTEPLPERSLKNAINRLMKRIDSKKHYNVPDVVNINYWFYPHVIKQLAVILSAIKATTDPAIRDFFKICFSICIRKVSLADPHLSVPVRLRLETYPEGHRLRKKSEIRLRRLRRINVFEEIHKIICDNFRRITSLNTLKKGEVHSKIICTDARNLFNEFTDNSKLGDGSVDLVITSPPYVGAQKYIRASSLNLGWLEMCSTKELKKFESESIGREHYHKKEYAHLTYTDIDSADDLLEEIHTINPLRAHIASNYLIEMRRAFTDISRILKPGGHLVLVAANNHVCKKEFATQEFLSTIIENLGLSCILKLIDDIRSRGLMTKRNKTASVITREWILVFRKEQDVGE